MFAGVTWRIGSPSVDADVGCDYYFIRRKILKGPITRAVSPCGDDVLVGQGLDIYI